jgi:soluble lytic murein transglycosylase
MSFHLGKLLVIALSSAILASLATVSSGADDLLEQAGDQFRDKDYTDAVLLARKAGESAQRTFMLGMALVRMGKPEEGLPLLAEAELKLPLLGDYAALSQADALLKLRKYPEAAAKTASVTKMYPASLLIRRAEKLSADIAFEAGNFTTAFKFYQGFVEKYASGSDSVEALFQSARCREETGDRSGSAAIYRNIWLNNPTSAYSTKSQERLKELENAGIKSTPFTQEELLLRASTLANQNEHSGALRVLQSIPTEGRSLTIAARIDLRSGMAHYRLRHWKEAEKNLTRAVGCTLPGISSEARFWLAKSLERQDRDERALELYMSLAGEGKKQEFADDALMEAAGLRRSQGNYSEAARLYKQIARSFPESKFISRAAWESGWCHYLAGKFPEAAEIFRPLLKDEGLREKVTYWLARSLENMASGEANSYFKTLQEEYPAGFYATWYREQKGIKDLRETLGQRNALAELPLAAGFDKPRLLATVGMIEESRTEMAAARKKAGDKKSLFPGLARVYLEMKDYGSAIALFLQNRPIKWDTANLPLWTAGYPLVYGAQVAQHSAANALSESLMFALIRAESGFSPAIKSHAGAIGLMQLMPSTAKMTAQETGTFNPQNLTIPEYNIKLGTKHFRDLMKGYDGDVVYSVAAYNAGSAAVDRWRKGLKGLKKDEFIESIPYQETRDYVKKVYASAATYRQLYGLK